MGVNYSSADGKIEPSNSGHPLVERSYALHKQVTDRFGSVPDELGLIGRYREVFKGPNGKIDWERLYLQRIFNYEDLLGIGPSRSMEGGAEEYEEIIAAQEMLK